MIAKTVTGHDFSGALEYGAGLRSDRTNKQAELLSVANLGSQEVAGMAAEMRAVAELSSRIQLPVWHTVLSWAPGEVVSRTQKVAAARGPRLLVCWSKPNPVPWAREAAAVSQRC
ncbi:relaxase/mobilization nuclease domain-containing protein [Hymenobacter wooponensis]|uniref:MobA/VirD2-like nuclease domain-containing protein n=1 Tax=Hymenobacter wooponensis TaxID=1525360 RepID=A0A4Z0MDP1_9BACT|nr:hypothetical protein [Hymenobacter wooponensis]TGD77621.1 hypothetical protein EU557_22870 [Hymenobacter wooponensis]